MDSGENPIVAEADTHWMFTVNGIANTHQTKYEEQKLHVCSSPNETLMVWGIIAAHKL